MEALFTSLFFLAFAPTGILVAGRLVAGLAVSMLFSIAVATLTAQLHIYTDLGMSNIFWSTAALQFLALLVPRFREAYIRIFALGLGRPDLTPAATLIFCWAAFTAAAPPLAWDARSIWLSKASWLNGPANQYLTAQQDNLSGQPEYPLAGPASIATVWSSLGIEEDLHLGVAVNSLIPVAIIGAALSLAACHSENFGNSLSSQAFAMVPLVCLFSLSSGLIVQGLMDISLAASVSALAILLFRAGNDSHPGWLFCVTALIIIAGNLKQEGAVFSGIVLAAFYIWRALAGKNKFRVSSRAYFLFFAIWGIDRALWSVFSNFAGLRDSVSTSEIFANSAELLSPDSKFYEYIGKVLTDPRFSWTLASLAIFSSIVLFVELFVSIRLRRVIYFYFAPFVTSSVLVLATIGVTYSLGGDRDSLDWWLANSLDRLLSTPILLLVTMLSLAVVELTSTIERSSLRDAKKDGP